MTERREVRIHIGRRNYRMQTNLDEATLSRVMGIVNEVGGAVGQNVDHEHLLMLTCLQLAYNLEKISHILEPLEERFSDLPSWAPLPDEKKVELN